MNIVINNISLFSGYPVLTQKVEFKKKGRSANRSDWTKFIMITKVSIIPDILISVYDNIQWNLQ